MIVQFNTQEALERVARKLYPLSKPSIFFFVFKFGMHPEFRPVNHVLFLGLPGSNNVTYPQIHLSSPGQTPSALLHVRGPLSEPRRVSVHAYIGPSSAVSASKGRRLLGGQSGCYNNTDSTHSCKGPQTTPLTFGSHLACACAHFSSLRRARSHRLFIGQLLQCWLS